jgi:hypothetical protein
VVSCHARCLITKQATFDEVLDAVEAWPDDQQTELLEVIQRRLAERGRQQVAEDVQQSRLELSKGTKKPGSVDEIMREIEL